MTKTQKSTAIYPHPFSKAYWKDAAAELKSIKMLVVTALMIALRIVLKPLAIPLGPQLSIQTAMLATSLGAMIFGPVVAIPAAMISDTVGFMIYPTGDYFLPFMLTEIASTMLYALCLYRSKVTPTRVMLSRFFICFFVNVVMQQFIYAWWYSYIGNPEEAKEAILGIMTLSRILKNVAMFPIEAVVLTLFLKFLLPVTQRAKLTYCSNADMKFTAKQIITLVVLVVVGIGSATGKDKATEAPRLAISSPLLETTIAGAKGILISITASPDIGLEEIETASQLISDEAHPDAEIIWGVAFDDSLEDTMTITVVATGFDAPKKETKATVKVAATNKQPEKTEGNSEENTEAADPSVPDDDFLALWDIVQKKRNAGN